MKNTALSTHVECPYCRGCGIGTYWTHSLTETTDADCHVCDGGGAVLRDTARDAMSLLTEEKAKKYRQAHPELFQ